MNSKAAGIVLVAATTGRILLLMDPRGTWMLPGGGLEYGESEVAAVLRELKEETGYRQKVMVLHREGQVRAGDFQYGLYSGVVQGEFQPKLSHEHDDAKWFAIDKLPWGHLHQGLQAYFEEEGQSLQQRIDGVLRSLGARR